MVKVIISCVEDAIKFFEDGHTICINLSTDTEEVQYLFYRPLLESFEEVIAATQMAFRNGLEVHTKIDTSLTTEEYNLVQKHRDGYRGVYWHVDDFENAAQAEDDDTLYDRTKFQGALEEMIHTHDANYGISWDSVRYNLNEYCKLNQEDEESI